MKYIGENLESETFTLWKDYDAISPKNNIKTLCLHPSWSEDYLFDTPIILYPGVESLTAHDIDCLTPSFMRCVMKKFSHLKKLEIVTSIQSYLQFYEERSLTSRSEFVSILKYLYSIQTATGIFLEICAEEAPIRLLSLFQSLGEKQLRYTTFVLDFNKYNFQDNAVVINFTRHDPHNKIHIMLDDGMDCHSQMFRLLDKIGIFIFRLHLKSITKDLGKIMNMVSLHCLRTICLVILDGGDPGLDCSPSHQDLCKSHSVERLEIRDYQVTVNMFALIYRQFPWIEELELYGFNYWNIPGSYFPMVAPDITISYFRLRLDLYSENVPFKFRKVFIKLETREEETRYYDLNLDSPTYVVENYLYPHINSTEEDYQNSIEDDSYMTLFTQCHSVQKFIPTFSPSQKR